MASLSSRVVFGAGVAVALMLHGSPIADAQPGPSASGPSAGERRAARELVAEAIAAHEANDYDRAIELYRKAFALVPHPILMFNIGQAHRLAGRSEQAAVFYRRYLELDPKGPEVAAARAHLARIKATRTTDPATQHGAFGETARPGEPRERAVAATSPGDDEEDRPEEVIIDDEPEMREGITEVPSMDVQVLSPGERAVDAVIGMSFTARRLTFSYTADASPPASYEQTVPAPGIYLHATVFPLAIGHERKGMFRHLGATVMYDRVLFLKSKSPSSGMDLTSTEQRYAVGVVFRYPLRSATTVVGVALRYGQQQFTTGGQVEIPNVRYTMIELMGFFHHVLGPRLILNINAGALIPMKAGEILTLDQYGAARVLGFEGSIGLDYLLTKNIFARGAVRLETLTYTFQGEGMRSMGVGGARDTYFGGVLTAGYLF